MQRLREISKRIAAIQATILLTFVYVVFAPFMWVRFRFGGGTFAPSWMPWNYDADTIEDCTKQY